MCDPTRPALTAPPELAALFSLCVLQSTPCLGKVQKITQAISPLQTKLPAESSLLGFDDVLIGVLFWELERERESKREKS